MEENKNKKTDKKLKMDECKKEIEGIKSDGGMKS